VQRTTRRFAEIRRKQNQGDDDEQHEDCASTSDLLIQINSMSTAADLA
jgi:hypothetical protein